MNINSSKAFNASQIEFFSQDEYISIIPNENIPVIHLMTGDVGPFISSEEVSVPLWLALQLKKANRCRILPPEWMDIVYLQKVDKELDDNITLNLPPHWREISVQLLESASDDLKDVEKLMKVLESIWNKRIEKLKKNLIKTIADSRGITHINTTNVNFTEMELNVLRPLFIDTVNQLQFIDTKDE